MNQGSLANISITGDERSTELLEDSTLSNNNDSSAPYKTSNNFNMKGVY